MQRNTGIPLKQRFDQPIWSKVALTGATQISFFNVGGAPTAANSIAQPNTVDQNADYIIKRIEVNLLTTAKTPFVTADLVLIGLLLSDCWLSLFTNQNQRAWYTSMSSLIKFPMAVAAAGASAYEPSMVVAGGTTLNEEIVIKGGQNMNFQLQNPSASALTGLTMEIVLWGYLIKEITAQV